MEQEDEERIVTLVPPVSSSCRPAVTAVAQDSRMHSFLPLLEQSGMVIKSLAGNL